MPRSAAPSAPVARARYQIGAPPRPRKGGGRKNRRASACCSLSSDAVPGGGADIYALKAIRRRKARIDVTRAAGPTALTEIEQHGAGDRPFRTDRTRHGRIARHRQGDRRRAGRVRRRCRGEFPRAGRRGGRRRPGDPLGGRAGVAVRADVSVAAEVSDLRAAAREFGPIDILVNNAGIALEDGARRRSIARSRPI